MSLIGLLNGLQDALIYPKADGDRQQGQADIRAHTDDAAHGEGEEQQQGGAEHHPCGLHIAPVEEIHHCRGESGARGLQIHKSIDFLFFLAL